MSPYRAGLIALLCAACLGALGAEHRKPLAPAPAADTVPLKDELPAGSPKVEDVDLIGDKPSASGEVKDSSLLERIDPPGPQNSRAQHAYNLLAEMRRLVNALNKDLDDGGKEITRLIRTSDQLARNVTQIADIWAENENFHDLCGGAKSRILTLNEELSRTPRIWSHMRWAFNDVVNDLRKLRARVRDLADTEPKPIVKIDKDGKPTYEDQPPSPADLAAAHRVAEKRATAQELERRRSYDDIKGLPEKKMATDLDGN